MTDCVAVNVRPGGERVACLEHDGPFHVGAASFGRYRWPRDPARPFPLPEQRRARGA